MNSRITTVSPRLNHEDVCDRPFGRDRVIDRKLSKSASLLLRHPRGYDCMRNPRGDLCSCVSFCEETSQVIVETSRATHQVIMTQGRMILHPDDHRPTVLSK